MKSALEQRCKDLVIELALGSPDAIRHIEALTGGVASDIAMIDLGDRRLCAKFALPKLKVAEDWYAPVHRNRAEYEWLRVAAGIAPESAVQLFGRSENQHGFAMEYLDGDDVYLWKSALLDGAANRGEAAKVGDLIGRIHAASAAPGFKTTPFLNREDFLAIRIDPYLKFTAGHWPQLKNELYGLADQLFASQQVLVHGDVSPKNIVFRAGQAIILDAECATMGDACFDASFCLCHLILKAVHLPASRQTLFNAVLHFWTAYAAHVSWEPAADLEQRICQLVPALLLARIDGKSPVEYLDEDERETVRKLAPELVKTPPATLRKLTDQLATQLNRKDA